MLDVADAHLARCLRDAGHVLWISDPSLPDVAGRADDDAEDDLALSEPEPLEVCWHLYPGLVSLLRSSGLQGCKIESWVARGAMMGFGVFKMVQGVVSQGRHP